MATETEIVSYAQLRSYRAEKLVGLVRNHTRQPTPDYAFINACNAEIARRECAA